MERAAAARQGGDAGGLRGQSQFTAGDEVELTRLSPYLQHDGAERIAGQRIGRGSQRGVGILGPHGHEQPRIEAYVAREGGNVAPELIERRNSFPANSDA